MAMERKEYIAPTAEWLLLAPKEDLMTGETSSEDDFALSAWGSSEMPGDSAITGGGWWDED